ncbi:MAG: hypothetical protein EGS78_08605 [Bacteroidales bacterium]|nr:hypothetical protein [Bacteroidales bacterium]
MGTGDPSRNWPYEWAQEAPAETEQTTEAHYFRPSWQDISSPQTDITHSTSTYCTKRRAFQPLPRPPFESTSWHYKNIVNIWLPSIYRIHLLSRGSKKIRSLLKKDAKARTGCCQEGRKFGTAGNASRRNSGDAYQKLDNQLSELMLQYVTAETRSGYVNVRMRKWFVLQKITAETLTEKQ